MRQNKQQNRDIVEKDRNSKQKEIKENNKNQNQEEQKDKNKEKDNNSNNDDAKRKSEKKAVESNQNCEKKEYKTNKKKKTRRSNKIKNTLKDFKIFYQNVRGLKSKVDSLDETLNDWDPSLACLVETHMSPEEEIKIPGYKIFRNDGTNNSKGILIAVKKSIKNITIEVNKYNAIGQMLWVLIQGINRKVRVGVIYGPQENTTPNNDLKILYSKIKEQVEIAEEESQQVLLIGDFNAKIGNLIQGNKDTITKSGRHLKRIVEKQRLKIINADKSKCRGIWTREQGKEKSVIDYVITNSQQSETMKKMQIDEDEQYGLYRVEKQNGEESRVYSDHHAILVNMNLNINEGTRKKKKFITQKGYQKYHIGVKTGKISQILEQGELQESYNKWAEAVENEIKKVEQTRKGKNPRKDIRILQQKRRQLRKEIKNSKSKYDKSILLERIKILKEHIIDKLRDGRAKKIEKIAESIKNNIDNGGKIWEVKRKFKKRDQTPHFITNSEGQKLEEKDDIVTEYGKYYKQLLQIRQPDNKEEEEIEQMVNKKFQEIITKPNKERETITTTDIEKAIRGMKNKKAGDVNNWKAEWIKEGGEEMVKSLAVLYNRMEMEKKVPAQWRKTKIKSTYKGGNREKLQESQRGIFLINIISKVYERVKKIQNEDKQAKISNMQTAAKKNRSTSDNLIIMNAIIERQREEKKNTYIFYADAEKCFDKLWLKDCLLELNNIGYSDNDIEMLYRINNRAEIVVETEVGNTDTFEIKEVVKQGSIFGPTMCSATTAKVNEVGEEVKYQYGSIQIGMSIYMDDISAAGGAEQIRKGIRNCARMEVEKKMKYGLKKTRYMIMKTGNEKEEIIEEKVKAGKVQRTDKYKYLGIEMNEEGNLNGHIEYLKRKGETVSREIEAIGAKNQVGREQVRVQLKLLEACYIPAILYGIEAWGYLKKEEIKELERLQGKALKRIFHLPISTSNIGILMETGIWPVEQKLQYATLMLYHNIMNSDEDRVARKIIIEQRKKEYKRTYYQKVKNAAKDINIDIDKVEQEKKSKWKKEVKEKIVEKIKERMNEEMMGKTKSRTIENDKWGRKEYIKECSSDVIKDVIKIRLHMWEVGRNYGKEEQEGNCPICKKGEDTTEHVLECDGNEKELNLKDERGKKWTDIVEIYRRNKEQR